MPAHPFDDITTDDLTRTRLSASPVSSEYEAGFRQRLKACLDRAQPQINPYPRGTAAADAYDAGFDDALRFLENGLLVRVTILAQDAARIIGWTPDHELSALEFCVTLAQSRSI